MKRLTCEICGSTDLIKQDGVFVCQSCGLKYSVEEARKMMIEGTVDIKGTVQIDNSVSVQKYLANARRAKEKEDWEEVEKYYNMVEQNDPDNIEAIFYSAYGKAKQTLTDSDIYKRKAAFKVLKNCISIIDDHYQIDRREECKAAIINMADDLAEMVCSNFVYTERKNGYGLVVESNEYETYSLFASLLDAFKESIDNIEKIDDQPYMHEASIKLYRIVSNIRWKNLMTDWIREEENELKELQEKIFQEFSDETKFISDEIKSLDDKKASFNAIIISKLNEIKNIPEQAELASAKEENSDIRADLDYIGPFQHKKEKILNEKLEENCKRIEELETAISRISKPIEDEVEDLRKQIKEIDARLTELKKNKYEMAQELFMKRETF